MRDVESLDHLRAAFPLGPPPDLVRLGLDPAGFDYADPAVTDPVRDAFLEVQATVAPDRGHMTDDPADDWYIDTYTVSLDDEGRLHSTGDRPATYLHEPRNNGWLLASYCVHGDLGRPNDLPDRVALFLTIGEVAFVSWSVTARPDGGPTGISQNGGNGYLFSWLPGRWDGPTAVARDNRQWGVPSDAQVPRWLWPCPVVYDIAYLAAEPLTDADARLLVRELDTIDPDTDERALLVRTLLRWQTALSDDTRAWLHSLL